MKTTDEVKSLFSKFFTRLGSLINQNVSKDENLKAKKAMKTNQSVADQVKPQAMKEVKPKEVYSYKGSGYKGKGNVNTDAAVFNHPRR